MSEHYYTCEGKAAYTQPNKSKPGTERPTTLADAKKLGLIPSVTGYVHMLAAHGLTDWKVREAVKAAANSPIHPGEDVDSYVSSIIEKSQEQVGDAADFGTRLHNALEVWFESGIKPEEALLPYIDPALDKMTELQLTPLALEKVLVEPHYGYAGKTDMVFEDSQNRIGILDYKSKRTKPGEKPFKSFEYQMQLAAYWMAEWGPKYEMSFPPHALCYNIYISTTEPGRVDVLAYDDAALRKAWAGFKACLELYRFTKGYDARVKDV